MIDVIRSADRDLRLLIAGLGKADDVMSAGDWLDKMATE
jgi:hypothetical protein